MMRRTGWIGAAGMTVVLAGCLGKPELVGEQADAVFITNLQTLYPWERIGNDGSGESTRWLINNGFELDMQEDCNLVLYDTLDANWCGIPPSEAHRWHVMWESNTDGRAPSNTCYVEMQHDGNLVIYRHDTGEAIWETATGPADSWLTLQGDGNLVMYFGPAHPANKVWSTNTWRRNPGAGMRQCNGAPPPTTGNLSVTVKGLVATQVGCANVPVFFTLDQSRTQSTTGSSTGDPAQIFETVCRWSTSFWGVANGEHNVCAVMPDGDERCGSGTVLGGMSTIVHL